MRNKTILIIKLLEIVLLEIVLLEIVLIVLGMFHEILEILEHLNAL